MLCKMRSPKEVPCIGHLLKSLELLLFSVRLSSHCVHTHTHTHTPTRTRTRTHTRTHTHTHTHAHTRIRTHTHAYAHTHTRIRTHVRARAHTHTHTYSTHTRIRTHVQHTHMFVLSTIISDKRLELDYIDNTVLEYWRQTEN
jgi:hypothetical protein